MLLNEALIIVALTVANGFFAGSEIALVAVRKARIQELAEKGQAGAKAVLALRSDPERFLATVQVGMTVVGATAAAFGGASIAKKLEPLLARNEWLREHAEGVSLALVVAAVSFLTIVIGELVPKSLALRASERYAMLVARPLVALSFLARPLVWVLSLSANVLLKPFGDKTNFTEARHSPQELQQLVEEAGRAGTVNPEAAEIATRALELPELVASDVMVHRRDVIAIAIDIAPDDLQQVLLEQTKTRIPVYRERIDNVVGYINVKDLLAMAWEHRLVVLQDVVRSPFFVPDTMNAVELIKEMRRRHQPLAIVVDEHGGMAGIATMEDLLEELVGEIFSEHDVEGKELIAEQKDGTVLVSGLATVRDVNRALRLELPDNGSYSTIAGLALALAGRLPTVGESFEAAPGVVLEISEASPRRIRFVRLRIEIDREVPAV
ncbi:MAG TPA: hemolysin family protein [Polyangiaceae bacterium]|nr:hemolysin family protein [Polyangiaceae bacterium]